MVGLIRKAVKGGVKAGVKAGTKAAKKSGTTAAKKSTKKVAKRPVGRPKGPSNATKEKKAVAKNQAAQTVRDNANKKTTKATSTPNLTGKTEMEGARLDPQTGAPDSASKKAVGEGKVTTGKKSGNVPNYIDNMYNNPDAPRTYKAVVTKAYRGAELTTKEKKTLAKAKDWFDQPAKSKTVASRQQGDATRKANKAAVNKSEGQLRSLMQDGVLFDGASDRQIMQAVRNLERREMLTDKQAENLAKLEKKTDRNKGIKSRGGSNPANIGEKQVGTKPYLASAKVRKAASDKIKAREADKKRLVEAADRMVGSSRKDKETKFANGGLVRKGHTDLRKAGLFK